jgi:hypothetical protein
VSLKIAICQRLQTRSGPKAAIKIADNVGESPKHEPQEAAGKLVANLGAGAISFGARRSAFTLAQWAFAARRIHVVWAACRQTPCQSPLMAIYRDAEWIQLCLGAHTQKRAHTCLYLGSSRRGRAGGRRKKRPRCAYGKLIVRDGKSSRSTVFSRARQCEKSKNHAFCNLILENRLKIN